MNKLITFNEFDKNSEKNNSIITLFHPFTALTPSANLWIDVVGNDLAKLTTADDCVEPFFFYVYNICQIIFNILFINSCLSTISDVAIKAII